MEYRDFYYFTRRRYNILYHQRNEVQQMATSRQIQVINAFGLYKHDACFIILKLSHTTFA